MHHTLEHPRTYTANTTCRCGEEKTPTANLCQSCAGQENLNRWKAKRAEAKQLLSEGATPEEVQEMCGVSPNDSMFRGHVEKRGPGRPRKDHTTQPVVTEKRGPGRPRKDHSQPPIILAQTTPPERTLVIPIDHQSEARPSWHQVREWFATLSVTDMLSIRDKEEREMAVEFAAVIVSKKMANAT